MCKQNSIGKKIFAAYRGESWITDGSLQEIADFLNVSVETVKYRRTPAAHRKYSDTKGSNAILIYFLGHEHELV